MNKFVEKRLSKIEDESMYIDVWYETNFSKKYCFNYLQFGYKAENCRNSMNCGNYAILDPINKKCNNFIIIYINYQKSY